MEEREPMLQIICGKKGVGKSYLTKKILDKYVVGNPSKGVVGRKVLIFDVNDEYVDVKALSLKDVIVFSIHPKIEMRRIRPFHPDGRKMGIRDLQNTLFLILEKFKGGLLLIEDISKYISDSLPQDIVGNICTNRHNDLDIIIQLQSVGRITPKLLQNLNVIRMHKISDSVMKHKEKFQDMLEPLSLIEMYLNKEYFEGNIRVYAYFDADNDKIRGVDKRKFIKIIEEYLSLNYNTLIKPLLNQRDLGMGSKSMTAKEAVKFQTDRIVKYYLN